MVISQTSLNKIRIGYILPLVLLLLCFSTNINAQNTTSSSKDYFTIESYYKVKWGYADEFIDLWKKNHYPLLKKALEKGDVINITASRPKFHGGEDTRWDFRVTVVFKTVALAFDENLTEPYKKRLYPDQDAYIKAEQHRFELLIAHWDIEVGTDQLN